MNNPNINHNYVELAALECEHSHSLPRSLGGFA